MSFLPDNLSQSLYSKHLLNPLQQKKPIPTTRAIAPLTNKRLIPTLTSFNIIMFLSLFFYLGVHHTIFSQKSRINNSIIDKNYIKNELYL